MILIFCNCYSAHTGGGITVAQGMIDGLLSSLSSVSYSFVIYCSPKSAPYFQSYSKLDNVQLIISQSYPVPGLLSTIISLFWELPLLCRTTSLSDYIFLNFSDLPIPFVKNQVLYFDWSFAICSWYELFSFSMPDVCIFISRFFKRCLLKFLFAFSSDYLKIVCQTRFIQDRLSYDYSFSKSSILVLPNPASSFTVTPRNDPEAFAIDQCLISSNVKILLCLSAYYTHKNLFILPTVAKLLASARSDIVIFTTFDPYSSVSASRLDSIISRTHNIFNLGPIDKAYLPELYSISSALLLPSLLESYSGCYQEAFSSEIPVLTSALPFAFEICEDAAVYFDPYSPESIFQAINTLFSSPSTYTSCILNGVKLRSQTRSWHDNAIEFFSFLGISLS